MTNNLSQFPIDRRNSQESRIAEHGPSEIIDGAGRAPVSDGIARELGKVYALFAADSAETAAAHLAAETVDATPPRSLESCDVEKAARYIGGIGQRLADFRGREAA